MGVIRPVQAHVDQHVSHAHHWPRQAQVTYRDLEVGAADVLANSHPTRSHVVV